MRSLVEKDYKYRAAGRIWLLPELHLVQVPDGTLTISQDEIDRIHRAIANHICGSPSNLSFDELEFLCDASDTPFYEVADHLCMHKSTLSKWRKSGSVSNSVLSLFLKRWFWFKLFGDRLGNKTVRLKDLGDETEFLAIAKTHAIGQRLTDRVEELTAT